MALWLSQVAAQAALLFVISGIAVQFSAGMLNLASEGNGACKVFVKMKFFVGLSGVLVSDASSLDNIKTYMYYKCGFSKLAASTVNEGVSLVLLFTY